MQHEGLTTNQGHYDVKRRKKMKKLKKREVGACKSHSANSRVGLYLTKLSSEVVHEIKQLSDTKDILTIHRM